jgi:hypothetical protein
METQSKHIENNTNPSPLAQNQKEKNLVRLNACWTFSLAKWSFYI